MRQISIHKLANCAMLATFIFVVAGCAPTALFRGQSPFHPASGRIDQSRSIYVVGHGWHTGVILDTSEIDVEDWPEIADFKHHRYVEIGWGDEGFYRAKSIDPLIAARAIFTPTPSVLHVVGFDVHPKRVFVGSDLIELRVTEEGYRAMCRGIHETYARDAADRPLPLGRGLYGDSRFYRAVGSYYYPKTCNIWTAKMLQRAELPILLPLSTTAGGVLQQVKSHGRVLGSSSPMALIHALGWGKSDGSSP